MLHVFVVLLSYRLGQAPAATTTDCRPDSPSGQQVRAVADGIIAADNARDLERVRAFYAADAVLLPPEETPVQGWNAIRPRYEALFSGFNPAISGHIDEICVSGAFAFVRGRNDGRLEGRDGQTSRVLNDVYLMLLRYQAGTGWRISHLVWHSTTRGRRTP